MPNLPAGLQGFVAAQQNARQGDQANLQNFLGILQLQAQMEGQRQAALLHPLQLAQLQASVDQSKENMALRKQIMSGIVPGGSGQAPMAFGEGGISTPGGGQANMMTGQTVAPSPGMGVMGGGMGGVNPLAGLMMLSGDAGMGKLGTAIQEANKPLAAREGAPIINPATGQIMFYAPKLEAGMQPQFSGGQVTGVSNIPGYVQSMGERTQSQEGIKAGMDPYLGELDAQGRPIPQTRAGFAARYSPQSDVLRTTAPNAQDALKIVQDAEARGQQASVTAPGAPRGMGPSAAEAAAATTTAKERAEGGVKFEQAILDSGRVARNNVTQLQILAPMLEKMPTGPIYNTMLNGAALFKQFGLDVGEIGRQVGPAQASEAILNRMALAVRNPAGGEGMPGAMSDPDREFLLRTIPNLSKSPDGNKMLIKIMTALEERKVNEATIVNKMQSANMNSNQIRDALSQYAQKNSLSAGLQ